MNERNRNGFGGMEENNHNFYSMKERGWYRVYFDSGKFVGRFSTYDRKGIVSFDRIVGTSEVTGMGMVCSQLERLLTIVHSSIIGIQQMTEEDVESVVKETNFPLAYLGREVSVKDEYGVLDWVGNDFVILRPHIARRIRRGAWQLNLSKEMNYVPYERDRSIIEPLPNGTLRGMVRVCKEAAKATSANGKSKQIQPRLAMRAAKKTL